MGEKVLLVDNYDSFTYNLVQYIGELGAEVLVRRNDEVTIKEVEDEIRPDRIVVSPGPGTPDEAGVTLELIGALAGHVPVLGVCLGRQAIGQIFGGRVVRGPAPVHGKPAEICHDGKTIFEGLEYRFPAGRYHSLVAAPELPEVLERSAFGGDVVMAVRHRELPAEGVQFHPESVLTEQGKELLANFLSGAR